MTTPYMLRGVDVAAFAVALVAKLRGGGVVVSADGPATFVHAMRHMAPQSRVALYWAARLSLVNRAEDMAAFDAVDVPILLIEVQPRTFCGAEYNATYSSIFPGLAEEFGALLYTDKTPPPPDERPEGVNYITRPVPFDDVLPHVEALLARVGR